MAWPWLGGAAVETLSSASRGNGGNGGYGPGRNEARSARRSASARRGPKAGSMPAGTVAARPPATVVTTWPAGLPAGLQRPCGRNRARCRSRARWGRPANALNSGREIRGSSEGTANEASLPSARIVLDRAGLGWAGRPRPAGWLHSARASQGRPPAVQSCGAGLRLPTPQALSSFCVEAARAAGPFFIYVTTRPAGPQCCSAPGCASSPGLQASGLGR